MKRYLILLMVALVAPLAKAQPADPIPQQTLLAYLDQLTQWQREAVLLEPSPSNPREIVFRDSLRETATHVLQSGFQFMRGVAEHSPPTEVTDPESNRARLMARQAQIEQELATAQGDERRLAEARLQLVKTILANMNSASNKSPNKLKYTIDSLSRSIPELNGEGATVKTKAEPPKRMATGILGTSAGIFEATRKGRDVDEVIDRTSQLKDQSMALMKTLRAGLGEQTPQEKQEADEQAGMPVAEMTVDERIAAYGRIAEHIVPLAETMRRIDTARQTLREWSAVVHEQRDSLLRRFGIQMLVLLGTLAIPLVGSELVRRAFKKVRDTKRKRQLNNVRRIITGIAIVLIVLVNFISDFSSFATFAGFLTAGLAVALQSVLLSLVAHFLFYGRYGVRVGDRIHVAGVTGDIQQIGMVRFYVRELEETKTGLKPTGKLVAFPNSIVFQNVAFYKYEAAKA